MSYYRKSVHHFNLKSKMESKKNVPNTYSLDFKLKVLSDMCSSDLFPVFPKILKKEYIRRIRKYLRKIV